MQPYQSSVASPPTKPLGFLYGLGIGVIGGLLIAGVDIVLGMALFTYRISNVPGTYFNIYMFGHVLIGAGTSCAIFMCGSSVSKRTLRAGSATLVGLIAGGLMLLSTILSTVIFQMLHSDYQFDEFFIALGAFVVMTYLGFISGLVGRAEQPKQATIGQLYAIALIIILTLGQGYILIELAILLVPILSLVIWIMLLVEYSRVQAWGAFTLTLFFSGIMVLVYLINGAKPPQAAILVQPIGYLPVSPSSSPVHAPVASPPFPMPTSQVPPANTEAIAILQQRYARGEIDAEAYHQMLATLTKTL